MTQQNYEIPVVMLINVDKILPAPYNPLNRTTAKSLSKLQQSIVRVGIQQPLLVTKKLELIDGHRRLACAKSLNFLVVPCIISDGDRSELFTEVNSTTKSLRRADDLFVYLSGGKLTGRSRSSIDILERILGLKNLETIAELGLSPSSIISAGRYLFVNLLGYTNWTENKEPFIKKALMWLVLEKQQFSVRVAATVGIDKNIVLSCIENNKPLPKMRTK